MSARATAAVAAALALSATVMACGGGGEQAPAAAAPAAAVEMADLRFEPRDLTVKRGTTVTFRNVGKVTHNVKGKSFFSRVVEPGASYRHRFDEAGAFDYVCTFHPGMEGTLTVE